MGKSRRFAEISRVIESLPVEKLPEMHLEIESGNWPEELGEKPIDSDEEYKDFIECVLAVISCRVGLKAIWRLKKEKEGFPPQMFEDWWSSKFIGHQRHYQFIESIADTVEVYLTGRSHNQRYKLYDVVDKSSKDKRQKCNKQSATIYAVIGFLGFFILGYLASAFLF